VGDLLADCLAFQDIKVLDQGKVIVVLPILEQTSTTCHSTQEHFHQKVALPSNLAPGRHLLHVRSLNGRSLNRLFEVGL
jgi:hypothetical protein